MSSSDPRAVRPAHVAAREAMLLEVIARLDQIIGAETAALRELRPVDTTPYAVQKSQSLLELARLMRHGDLETSASARLREKMASLRARLDENRSALDLHLNAARQVFETVSKAINEAESDRTYSASATRRKEQPS